MASLSIIRARLKPWPSSSDPKRYYVNNVESLILDGLFDEYNHTGFHKPIDVVKFAKVWFDNQGHVHVEGIYDRDAADVIARLVDEEFTESDLSKLADAVELDWSEATDALPHDLRNETYHFDYKGRDYCVNTTVYCWERERNSALRYPDGSIDFESASSDLWELVLELVKDGKVKPKPSICDMYGSLVSWDNITLEPTKIELAHNLNPDDPEKARPEYHPPKKREPGPQKKPAPKPEPRLVLHRLTDEEIERMSRESAMETRHPKSRWSKAEVIEVCERAGMPRESISALKRMRLEDIRSNLLLYDGTDITGNDYIDYQQRHTRFYRLDFDLIRMLGDDDRVMRDRSWHDRESLWGKVWGVTPRLQAGGTVSR